ncbi:MAG: hypothetical protein ABIA12_03080 [Candidatus Aenigmatarchaeota archaeon]
MFELLAALAPFAALLLYALTGSIVRLFFGIYKAYSSIPFPEFSLKRMAVEVVVGIVFGAFGGAMLQEMGALKMAVGVGTVASSLLGPNVIELITKKFGWSKNIDIVVTEQQLHMADLNLRQIAAMQHARERGRITNDEYQRLNGVTHDIAKYELAALVRKKRMMRTGSTKDVFYAAM